MATSPASTRNVRGAGAMPGALPPIAPATKPAAAGTPINPDMAPEKLVSRARQEELVALAESGSAAEAIEIAVREALQGLAAGEPVLAKRDVKTPADIARENRSAQVKSQAISVALAKHFRSELDDTPVSSGPAITEMKMSLQYMRVLTPFVSAVIHNPGEAQTVEQARDRIIYMQAATAEMAKVMASAITSQVDYTQYEQRELNLMLANMVGHAWERAPAGTDPQESLDEMLKVVRAVYADKGFALRHKALAEGLLTQESYLKVGCPEDMTSRLNLSLHLAGMKFLEATGHERVKTPHGVTYTYNKKRSEIVSMMVKTLDTVMAKITMQHQFVSSLSNDLRTSTLQAWMRVTSKLMADEYVEQTARNKNSLLQIATMPDRAAFNKRYVETNAMLPQIIEKAGEKALRTVQDIISQSIGETARVRGENYTQIQLAAEQEQARIKAAAEAAQTQPVEQESQEQQEPANAPR